MSKKNFANVKACVFDAYGTLFDVHSPVAQVAGKLGDSADGVSKLWRQKQLEYTWLRSLMREHTDFWTVTGEALEYALVHHGIHNAAVYDKLMDLYLFLRAYDDARPALEKLQSGGMKTAILSNGNPHMLDSAVTSADLADVLDDVISVEDVGIYKPDRRVYQMAVDRMQVERPDQICFVSANTWDAQAAAQFGFQVARINRFGLPDDNIPGRPAALVVSLYDLARLVTAANPSA